MPQLTANQEYCSFARALSVLGERWTLLIVRDLLSGPKRFSELERLVVGISPKWLTARLRSLEEAGLVLRNGRDYLLSPQGEGLRASMEELSLWATAFDSREPRPDEVIVPEHDMWALEAFLNRNLPQWNRPVTWVVDLGDDGVFTLTHDGKSWTWSLGQSSTADLHVRTSSREWASVLARAQAGKKSADRALTITGKSRDIQAFKELASIS